MEFDDLEQMLRETFDDRVLSRTERQAMDAVLADLSEDEERLRFVRNRAFAIVREALGDGEGPVVDWLEAIVRAVNRARDHGDEGGSGAYFSPGTECRNQVVGLINGSRSRIEVCVFTITDDPITRALLAAHQRGVQLRIITDDEKAQDRGSVIGKLERGGIPVVTDASPDHMHNKFALFDGRVLVNGSFNWTRSASLNNIENIIVSREKRLVEAFGGEFERLWETFGAAAR